MPSLNLDTPRESNSGNIVNETSINDSEHLSDCMFERENVPDFQVKCSGFVLWSNHMSYDLSENIEDTNNNRSIVIKEKLEWLIQMSKSVYLQQIDNIIGELAAKN